MNEFELIKYYFKSLEEYDQKSLLKGIGDDAAIIEVPSGQELLISMDTLVSETHFFPDTRPEDIAYKSLAVNLSDMAAMAALPKWVSLSLTMPELDRGWMDDFVRGFKSLMTEHSLTLIGGDMSTGPLSITIQIQGLAPRGKSLQRSGARKGDLICVSGNLGAAAYALKHMSKEVDGTVPTDYELKRFYRPEARVELGMSLRHHANSCIDISDGLVSDLGHILTASKLGAEIILENIPLSESLLNVDEELAYELALSTGDDYELCFTLPADIEKDFIKKINQICPITHIGTVFEQSVGLQFKKEDGSLYQPVRKGFQHFN